MIELIIAWLAVLGLLGGSAYGIYKKLKNHA